MQRTTRLLITALAVLLLPAATAAAGPATTGPEQTLAAAEEILRGGGAGASASAQGREASDVLRRLALVLPKLRGDERARAQEILARPDSAKDQFGDHFGQEAAASPICDDHFCVHWGSAAKHAPSPVDADANGVPDFADQVLAAGAQSYAVENGLLAWQDARSDGRAGARNGRGGGGEVDIYLVDLGNSLFGYAAPDGKQKGRSRSGYLVVDNDYKGFDGNALDLMRVTIAHEYNHILQFGYDVAQDGWMFESTATWVEDLVYPDINDYLNFVPAFAKAPFKPMAESERKATRLYGSAMWNHWLTAATGAATIRTAWEVSDEVKPSDFAIAAYERAISEAGGGSFSRQFSSFAATTSEWNSSAAFPDAGLYPEMRRSGSLQGARKLKLDHTAYRLYRVSGSGPKTLKVKAQRGTRSALALVAAPDPVVGGEPEIALSYLPRGGRGSVTLPEVGGRGRVTAVVINADGRVKGNTRSYARDGRRFRVSLSG